MNQQLLLGCLESSSARVFFNADVYAVKAHRYCCIICDIARFARCCAFWSPDLKQEVFAKVTRGAEHKASASSTRFLRDSAKFCHMFRRNNPINPHK